MRYSAYALLAVQQSVTARATVAPVSYKLATLVAASTVATIVAYNQYENKSMVRCDELPVHGIAGTNQERTFLAVKPDGVQRGLVGDIIARFEKRGYKVSKYTIYRVFVDVFPQTINTNKTPNTFTTCYVTIACWFENGVAYQRNGREALRGSF